MAESREYTDEDLKKFLGDAIREAAGECGPLAWCRLVSLAALASAAIDCAGRLEEIIKLLRPSGPSAGGG